MKSNLEMRRLRLVVTQDAYELWLDGAQRVGRLDGGAAALLAGAGERLREVDIERAIERAEDWLMPFSTSLTGLELEVCGATARLRSQLGAQPSHTAHSIEEAFTRAHDGVAHGRAIDREGVADIVLLRELAHHGRLSGIAWLDGDPPPHNRLE